MRKIRWNLDFNLCLEIGKFWSPDGHWMESRSSKFTTQFGNSLDCPEFGRDWKKWILRLWAFGQLCLNFDPISEWKPSLPDSHYTFPFQLIHSWEKVTIEEWVKGEDRVVGMKANFNCMQPITIELDWTAQAQLPSLKVDNGCVRLPPLHRGGLLNKKFLGCKRNRKFPWIEEKEKRESVGVKERSWTTSSFS